MSTTTDPDEVLVDELRALFAEVDPVPPPVTEAARAAFTWRRIDAELAELLTDSSLQEAGLAHARWADAPVRSVSFSAGETTIDVEIHVEGTMRTLLGQISPPASARIDVQRPDEPAVAAAEADSLGRFRAQLSDWGPIRLRVAGRGPGLAPFIETSWIPI